MDREIEQRRKRHALRADRDDNTFTRMYASDGAVWPRVDTGYRHNVTEIKWLTQHKS